ncbi:MULTISPECIES: hypothetical protein [unclassified Aureimonas]|uniref:hypothetical protein n=1 Tax=unclassified Aureimonas TaxID=2615206 RepID=UPI0006FDECA2|nr:MULTISPECIES: hypothetical protein [unclassified Aureimonas]KQT57432.1 hypothetical protein ASG62_08905 [Aureimonas sp. Leaf427]KQT77111.1 hypothetical protein ASG54_12770 [Aureimonas sp. Leaf460]
MKDEVGNIILEQLRLMRSQLSGFDAKLSSFDAKLDGLGERLNSVENAISGLAYILAETRGELIHQHERIEILEKA